MKVQFDFTLDDLVDTSQRGLKRSGTVRAMRLQGRIVISLVVGAIVFLVTSGSYESRLTYAVIGAVIYALIYPAFTRGTREKILRKAFRERMGGEGPFICVVELLPACVVTTQAGTRSEHQWSNFVAIEDTADSVDLVGRGADTVVVRDRAFHSPEERKQFLELAQGYLAAVKK
jgi:hypothetical protein